jgi:membrane carboxypeptidase/penicillin-binding protein PbpC
MAISPRPIGSTIKPFIYAHAFEKGARPYSLINDREYKYPIGTGYSLYPKNFDGKYAGEVTLHEALANSLNTPSVKLLEFTTLDSFYSVLEDKLGLTPINPLSSYAYGIALGGLEVDLLTLTHFFTVFTNQGELLPLSVQPKTSITPPLAQEIKEAQVFTPASIELVTSILTDRQAGVEQFGIKSTLEVFGKTVAVKTGTSRDFHDSWTIGYTPDYLVGVWLGNPENKPLDKLSGAAGAGTLWRQIVEHLATTEYEAFTPFTYKETELIKQNGSTYRSIIGDTLDNHRLLLLDKQLILRPHDQDNFLFNDGDMISLEASELATWSVDGDMIDNNQNTTWMPPGPGNYKITATTKKHQETITIEVMAPSTLLQ